jgi:hypothetical protein
VPAAARRPPVDRGAPLTTGPGSGPPPRTRRTRQELRALLLDAGIAVLRRDGLGTGAEHLTFKRVFDRVASTSGIRVTNASVIGRIWENQAEFQSDVLASVATDEVTEQEHAALVGTAEVAASIDRSTVEGRRAGLREVMRVAAETNLLAGTTSRSWASVIGVWALVSGSRGPATNERIYQVMRGSYEGIEVRSNATTEALLAFLGLRVRPPLRVDQFTRSCIALVEGCALRDRAEPGGRGIERPTGPGGAMQSWTVLGIAMEALVDEFFELDPDWRPETAS